MPTSHLQLKMKSKRECPLFACRLFVKIYHFYRKLTFSGVYTHFNSFLPSTYKSGTVNTLAYRCLRIYSSWTKLHTELLCLKHSFLKNGYPENFINKYFKRVIDKIHVVKETALRVENKPLVLVPQYLDSISLKTRTKLKKSLTYP